MFEERIFNAGKLAQLREMILSEDTNSEAAIILAEEMIKSEVSPLISEGWLRVVTTDGIFDGYTDPSLSYGEYDPFTLFLWNERESDVEPQRIDLLKLVDINC